MARKSGRGDDKHRCRDRSANRWPRGPASLRWQAAHTAHLGLGVHDDFTGRGIGKALLLALIDAADNWLNIRRLELTVHADNLKAIGLYEKCGFEREGVHRDYAFKNGRFVDALAMARLRLI